MTLCYRVDIIICIFHILSGPAANADLVAVFVANLKKTISINSQHARQKCRLLISSVRSSASCEIYLSSRTIMRTGNANVK